MRKFVTAIMAFLFIHLTYLCNAQTIPVTGRILSKDNTPVVGATVLVKGKKTGTKTDVNGTFTINANKGDILIISSVGHTTQQVKVTGSTLDVNLSNADKILDEVVVTAMDIKKNPRELGTSIQTISGNEIAATKRENFINGLQGRVAGITVTPTSGVAGSSSGIVLRGYNTMSGSNQPLFIVDGIILDNQTLNSNSQGGSGIGLASDLPNRNNDYTNRMADLNPNDIESISVLKGPEATALYGSQASSGAIVITTKKARSTNGKIRVTYDDNFRLQKITRFAKIDDNYGPGTNGVPPAPPITSSTTQYVSFGPAYPSNTKKYDNLHNFYQTGFSQTHNLGLEFGGKNSGYRFSSQYFDDHGVVPHNTYTKYNFKLSNNTKIGKYIDFSPSISYINADNVKPLKGANSYLLDLYMWPSIDNMQDYQLPNGDKKLFYGISQNGDYDNPLWSAKNNISGDQTDRWVATMSINIRPFPWLTLAGRFGYDTYKTDGYLFTHPESFYLAVGTGGTLDNYYRTYKGYNHTITAAANKKFGDFTTRLMVGTMWEDFETQQYSLVGNHLKDSTSTD
ncbi:MAG TPA: TonB-dependent receptor plug domain-containing protein, partial [Hanamia sp.]